MFSHDYVKGGYLSLRDHNTGEEIHVRMLNQGIELDVQSDIGETTAKNAGDLAGWFFWEANPALVDAPITGTVSTTTVEPDPGVEGTSRFVCPEDVEATGTESQQTNTTPKRIGSWMTVTACIMTDVGLLPINSKSGEPDVRYTPKQPILTPTIDDDFNLFRPLSQKVPAPGSTGILLQCPNQDRYELVFFEVNDNGGILVDHKSDLGLSTNVFDVNTDGTIDTANKHAAAIDSIFRVLRDENNAKVVAINGTQSGKDTTGFFPTFMKFDTTTKGVYLTQERGGPLHPGTNTDNRVIGQNKEGLRWGAAHLDTQASFFQSQEKHGAIDFKDKFFPQNLEDLENVVESEIVFDAQSDKWRIITDIGQDLSIAEGVIRWNIQNNVDLSEGQLILPPPGPNETEGPPVLIWISYGLSRAIQFRTMGDGCVFELKLLGEETRNGETRPFYRAVLCKQDLGREITHFERVGATEFEYFAVADDNNAGQDPWLVVNEARITTSIAGNSLPNIVPVELMDTYDLEEENYNWLNLATIDRGLNIFGAPICPTPIEGFGTAHFKMESSERFGDGTPIATYEIQKEVEIVTTT